MKNNLKGIKSIIFDLDGTLWDPTETSLKAWHKALNHISYIEKPISKEDLQGVMGLQHDLVGTRLFPYLTKEQQSEIIELCYDEEINSIKETGGDLYDNLEETIKILSQKMDLYIVSNCQSGYIEAFYEFHGLEKYFTDHECSGNTKQTKGENIHSIIERNKLTDPVYIGDTPGDFTATKENKIPFIFASYGFGKVKDADYKIDSIKSLTELF